MFTSATRARTVGALRPPRISISGPAASLFSEEAEKHGVETLLWLKECEEVRVVGLVLKSRKLKSRLVRDWSLHLCEDRLNCVNRSVSGSRAKAIQFMPVFLRLIVPLLDMVFLQSFKNVHFFGFALIYP